MGSFVNDPGVVMHAATIVVGDKLGLYKTLAAAPMTAEQLASRTGTDVRYIREWLPAQAASGYPIALSCAGALNPLAHGNCAPKLD